MPEKKINPFKIINLTRLSALSGVDYQKIYNVMVNKRYDSLTQNERTHISNALFEETKKCFRKLGFNTTIERITLE